jgi:phosphonoacetate hydrolase
VTVLLTADHGMQGSDPAVRGDWDAALEAAGVPFRDEANGFLYLGEDVLQG